MARSVGLTLPSRELVPYTKPGSEEPLCTLQQSVTNYIHTVKSH